MVSYWWFGGGELLARDGAKPKAQCGDDTTRSAPNNPRTKVVLCAFPSTLSVARCRCGKELLCKCGCNGLLTGRRGNRRKPRYCSLIAAAHPRHYRKSKRGCMPNVLGHQSGAHRRYRTNLTLLYLYLLYLPKLPKLHCPRLLALKPSQIELSAGVL